MRIQGIMSAGRGQTAFSAWLVAAALALALGAGAGEGAAETLTPGAAPGAEGAAPVAVDDRAPNPAPPPAAVKDPANSWRPIPEALKWLAKTQEEDGSWDARKHEGTAEPEEVTALAMLAFLGERNTATHGRYRKNVRAAQNWLTSRCDPRTGLVGGYRFTAPLAFFAIGEACLCDDDEALRPLVKTMSDFAMQAQSDNGGWGDRPEHDPAAAGVNPTASIWWTMALANAKLCDPHSVSDDCWVATTKYFAGVAAEALGRGAPWGCREADMATAALHGLLLLGRERQDTQVKGLAQALTRGGWIIGQENGDGGAAPGGKTDYQGWYLQLNGFWGYGTRAEPWRVMERRLEAIFRDLQEKEGENRGSWAPDRGRDGPGGFEARVGRVGVTAIACRTLGEFWYWVACREVHDKFNKKDKK